MSYRRYSPPAPLLFGYDPFRDLPWDHLARLVEQVVEETVVPARRPRRPGQPPYDPRLCVKVLIYSYCTGVRSSRVMERHCRENLPLLFLTRGDAPSYHTLCTARTEQGTFVEAVWVGLFSIAAAAGIERLGHIAVDSTKFRANASPDAVVTAKEYAALRQELERIQAEVLRIDAAESGAGGAGRTELGKTVPQEHMRDILRRVRRQWRRDAQSPKAAASAPPGAGSPAAATLVAREPLPLDGLPEPLAPPPAEPAPEPPTAEPMTRAMLQRIATALTALQQAQEEGRKHLCLTDPDARMMYGERARGTRECYSFEIATDNGLLVVGRSSQETHDNACLGRLVEAARPHEPHGIHAVDGDSGYYSGDAVAVLLRAGIDTCIPDSNTACDLHRGQSIGTTVAKSRGSVPFTYDAATDTFACPEGNLLVRTQQRRDAGQQVTVYRAQQSCTACPQRAVCLTKENAKHRTLRIGDDQELLDAARMRFAEPEHQARYHHRGEKVETVFGFLRGTLGYLRWVLRGAVKVECEAQLLKTAYQLRKVHLAWAQ